ncbi:MAG: VCBS repeat-containing protein [Proteobacteria bacterium]|jgi:hypothetical protein|nr:VCBS repeat-containing protein [Pseudomonadota bacterium]
MRHGHHLGWCTAGVLLLTISLAACKTSHTDPTTPATMVDGSNVSSYEIVPSAGSVPHDVLVLAKNSYGATVPSAALNVTVGGDPTSVSFDGHGYGAISLEEEGTHEITYNSETSYSHAFASGWTGFDAMRAGPGQDETAWLVRNVSTGMLVLGTNSLWFVNPKGESHKVLNITTSALEGLRIAHMDGDGILDAVTWTSEMVFVLRGNPLGGMSWGTALKAEGYTVAGADIGDVSGDGHGDIVVAWSGSKSWVDFWEGNNLWEFESVKPRIMLQTPLDLCLGDNSGEGRLQATAQHDGLLWDRFVWAATGEYIPIGPVLDVEIPIDHTSECAFDINGDEGDEIVFFGPFHPDIPRPVLVYDIKGTNPETIALVTKGAYLHLADTNGDEMSDLMSLESDLDLISLAYTGTNYAQRIAATMPEHAPMAFGHHDNDYRPEMLLAGQELWYWYKGGQNSSSSDSWWGIGELEFTDVELEINGPIVNYNVDHNTGTMEIVGFGTQNAQTYLKVWQVDPTVSDVATEITSVLVSASGAAPLDLDVCSLIAWALVEGEIVRVDLGTKSVTGSTPTTAKRVACGVGTTSGSRALLLDAPNAYEINNSLITINTVDATDAHDVAIAAVGGTPTIGTCIEEGCNIEAWTWGKGSEQAFATGGSTITFSDDAGEQTLEGSGGVAIGDADGNGMDDLVVTDDSSRIYLYRSTGTAIAPAEVFHLNQTPDRPVFVGDGTGDGLPDLWLIVDKLLFHGDSDADGSPTDTGL